MSTRFEYQQAITNWVRPSFADIESIALSLTFKDRVGTEWLSTEVAEKTVHHYLRRINRVGRGKRMSCVALPLRTLAIREGGIGKTMKRLHYHLQIEVPPATTAAAFATRCCDVWRRLDWGGRECYATRVTDDGWMDYMLKLRDKPEYCYALDVNNSWLARDAKASHSGPYRADADGSA